VVNTSSWRTNHKLQMWWKTLILTKHGSNPKAEHVFGAGHRNLQKRIKLNSSNITKVYRTCFWNSSLSSRTREPSRLENFSWRWRHHELAMEAKQELINWIASKAANNIAVNKIELLHECDERFEKEITREWVGGFFCEASRGAPF
jgi:hypothetical protein